ncbi:MAG: MotA/TolQ/ExbB proton channel family protein [Saccharofermentans sp.]|nr:MotA/TolQ/ExbB proton channel family protein [Saccharofermentans sp.]
MKREVLLLGFFFILVCGLLIVFAPDGLTMVFVVFQAILMMVGFALGIFRVSRYSRAFQIARVTMHRLKEEVQSNDMWVPLSRLDNLFNYEPLDKVFDEYKGLVSTDKNKATGILPDIENVINEDTIAIKTVRNTINQVPETLTGIGILGTFVGLIIGVSSIGFSSVAAAVTSLQSLISGIEVAFYTSIVGIILSICFNLTYKFVWNNMMRDMFLFLNDFHKNVIASEEEQLRDLEARYYSEMLKRL